MDEIKRDEIESKVKELTLDLDINYNSLNTKTKKHLINIEHSISNRETKYLELKNKLQGNKIYDKCFRIFIMTFLKPFYNRNFLKISIIKL